MAVFWDAWKVAGVYAKKKWGTVQVTGSWSEVTLQILTT